MESRRQGTAAQVGHQGMLRQAAHKGLRAIRKERGWKTPKGKTPWEQRRNTLEKPWKPGVKPCTQMKPLEK